MASRILSLLLGALLTTVGWALVDPKGLVGAKLPGLEHLGAFEGHRAFIGWGAVALGGVAILAALLRDDHKGAGRRRNPPIVDFGADPEPSTATEPAAVAEEPATPLGRSPSPSPLW
ncbi:hypothetical protein [Caulobacter mirabilis]|uniref:Uncharacterized protein n=1 Tax=Caulobacter mirabilis TaxID=69666 RepID=A0A2D2B1D6_9CAUL|nr:hypothetical protein [Caulobacter mirabilis]ATQ44084.1 hypothetical protein CSW64_17660 [Caulobacter mirabilis]